MTGIVIVGCPGSGKTTVARRLAADLGLDHIEIDGLFHQPGWQQSPPEEFRARLTAAMDAAPHGWVSCGNYLNQGKGIHHERADTVVWLDLPRRLTMRRVITRTFRRNVRREVLWNGNREHPLGFLSRDPEQNIILWAWQKYPVYRRTFTDKLHDGSWAHLRVVRLTSPDEVERWVGALTRGR